MKMIAAVSKNWGIGKDGNLLFRIPADMKFFRETTKEATVIMGRKTLDSFPNGAPLKNRVNVVLTRDADFAREGVIVCHTKEEVMECVKGHTKIFVIGGAEIYKMFLPECDVAYITKVDADADADKFIENLDKNPDWALDEQPEPVEDNGYMISFCRYKRK